MPRTDNDSWDLATSVGATATMVAAARAVASKADDPLIVDPFAEPLVRAVGVDFFTRWVTGEISADAVDDSESGWRLAHMPDAMAVRTRFFDGFFADAIDAGIRQAVILASGLDARAYRLDWPADMTVYEIDQPQVLEFKTTALADLGAEPSVDVRKVAIDLRNDWPAALTAAGLDTGRPTAWIAEGLFGYLPPEAQDRLLDNVTRLSAGGSRLASEAVPNIPDADREKAQEMMRSATAKWREHGYDLDWSELGYDGPRRDVDEFLDGLGWHTDGLTMTELLTRHGVSAPVRPADSVSVGDVVYHTSILREQG